jgi:hypothetical protein
MSKGIFSTYRQGENRVTSSILAVFRALSMSRTERLLGVLLQQPDFELVHFEDQPRAGGPGVPDAMITSSVLVLIETKITRGAVHDAQLQRHLQKLGASPLANKRLLVLTPDRESPLPAERLTDPRICWASFDALHQAIDELLSDRREVSSERETFLLRELQGMLDEERLLTPPTILQGVARSVRRDQHEDNAISASSPAASLIRADTVVVAAKWAWGNYLRTGGYECQPERSFRRVDRLAFYVDQKIETRIPRVESVHANIELRRGAHPGRLGEIVDRLLDIVPQCEGELRQIFVLSKPEDEATVVLAAPIVNDLVSDSGRVIAFTQGQRYASLDRLRVAKATSELL